MKVIKNEPCAQGELLWVPLDKPPREANLKPTEKIGEDFIAGHSETGHHHTVSARQATMFEKADSGGLVCYLRIDGEYADLVHHRSNHTHETIRFDKGGAGGSQWYEGHRCTEFTPEGERMVRD